MNEIRTYQPEDISFEDAAYFARVFGCSINQAKIALAAEWNKDEEDWAADNA